MYQQEIHKLKQYINKSFNYEHNIHSMCIRKMSSNERTIKNNIRREMIKSDIKNEEIRLYLLIF